MKTERIVTLEPTSVPPAVKSCRKCACNLFYCSEKFRINANKKELDIWLIFKCVNCDATYNVSILERVNRKSVCKNIYDKFSNNDRILVLTYAFDSKILHRNNIILEYSFFEFTILEEITFADILNSNNEFVELKIRSEFELKLRLSIFIKKFMGISSQKCRQLVESGAIAIRNIGNTNNCKIQNGSIIQLNTNELKKYFR